VNLFFIFSSSFALALSGALVPGPLFTITVTESVRRGFRAGPLIILGHGLLELTIVVLFFFKITPFLEKGRARLLMSVAGGIILIVMGGLLLRDSRKARINMLPGERKKGLHPVVSGVLGSLTNPYWSIWWVTIGLGYLMSSLRFGIPGVMAFFAGHISADLLWYSMISYAVSRGQRLMGERGYRYLLFACGIFLICFGGWFLTGV
jgi:threonine/homoserine/homoserine lactone efflux protein